MLGQLDDKMTYGTSDLVSMLGEQPSGLEPTIRKFLLRAGVRSSQSGPRQANTWLGMDIRAPLAGPVSHEQAFEILSLLEGKDLDTAIAMLKEHFYPDAE